MYSREASTSVFRGVVAASMDGGSVRTTLGRLLLIVVHVDQRRVSRCHIFPNADRSEFTVVARTETVGCSFDWNWAVILRKLHIDEGKFSVAGVDACDERVVRHSVFPPKSLKDSCLNARGNSRAGNSSW